FQHCLGLLHALFRRVKNAEVVRIADKIGLSFSVREGLRHLGFHAMQRNVSQQWGGHSTLCEASNYAKRCEKNSDFRPFPVEFLCIVSDDGFEIFLKYLSGEHAYATTNAS